MISKSSVWGRKLLFTIIFHCKHVHIYNFLLGDYFSKLRHHALDKQKFPSLIAGKLWITFYIQLSHSWGAIVIEKTTIWQDVIQKQGLPIRCGRQRKNNGKKEIGWCKTPPNCRLLFTNKTATSTTASCLKCRLRNKSSWQSNILCPYIYSIQKESVKTVSYKYVNCLVKLDMKDKMKKKQKHIKWCNISIVGWDVRDKRKVFTLTLAPISAKKPTFRDNANLKATCTISTIRNAN